MRDVVFGDLPAQSRKPQISSAAHYPNVSDRLGSSSPPEYGISVIGEYEQRSCCQIGAVAADSCEAFLLSDFDLLSVDMIVLLIPDP
jgi:hypothetical protein